MTPMALPDPLGSTLRHIRRVPQDAALLRSDDDGRKGKARRGPAADRSGSQKRAKSPGLDSGEGGGACFSEHSPLSKGGGRFRESYDQELGATRHGLWRGFTRSPQGVAELQVRVREILPESVPNSKCWIGAQDAGRIHP